MPRSIALLVALLMGAGVALAQTPMQPTAPQKRMSPTEAEKMHACEKQAAEQNIKMDLRSKFVMDCMTKK
jgi:curli biogenesis system outer membrane secretion channel CsgG